ncbi:MAG: SIS domain-containing protein [Thermoleophilaceae bacterium]
MTEALRRAAPGARIDELVALRTEANAAFFATEAERLAKLCHLMAERFARGGRLLALGASPQARSDARHVAVEFVHPVIVGKRALPAIGLAGEGGSLLRQVELLAEPEDIVIGFGDDEPFLPPAAADATDEINAGVELARERGCLTLAFERGPAEWAFVPDAEDPFVRQELAETAYHLLWELVHIFFDHKGLLEGRAAGKLHDSGASSFLYPFLSEQEHDLGAVLADVQASVMLKAGEIAELRTRTLLDGRDELLAAAGTLRAALDDGGRLLVLGNGGSATDAMDAAADMRCPPHGWPARPALDLTEDTSIITAVLNDIGADAIFARQVIAHGRDGDVLLAMSTSGGSRNVISALAEARRRSLKTIAMVGYDGGAVAADRLADHVVVTGSEHIPRIQEAQTSAWHVLRELIEVGG